MTRAESCDVPDSPCDLLAARSAIDSNRAGCRDFAVLSDCRFIEALQGRVMKLGRVGRSLLSAALCRL